MEKQKNGIPVEMNRNNALIGMIVLVILLATGILPAIIELVLGLIFGLIGLVVGLVVGAIGLVIGLIAGAIGLVIGLAPIIVPLAIVYYLIKHRDSDETAKRKNDFV